MSCSLIRSRHSIDRSSLTRDSKDRRGKRNGMIDRYGPSPSFGRGTSVKGTNVIGKDRKGNTIENREFIR